MKTTRRGVTVPASGSAAIRLLSDLEIEVPGGPYSL
jgi:hypothetical protein